MATFGILVSIWLQAVPQHPWLHHVTTDSSKTSSEASFVILGKKTAVISEIYLTHVVPFFPFPYCTRREILVCLFSWHVEKNIIGCTVPGRDRLSS